MKLSVMTSIEEIMSSKGFLHVNGHARVTDMSSLEDFRDHTGICMHGPCSGFILSASNVIVKVADGTYRFLDGKWWWKKT
jgi:hypothetical protein